jgi:hypothetical protein
MAPDVGLLFAPRACELGTVLICVFQEPRFEECLGGGAAHAGRTLRDEGKGTEDREGKCGGKDCDDGSVLNVQHAASCHKCGVDHVME